MTVNPDVARLLRETREYLGLSQQFVASHVGLSRTAVSEIELGRREVKATELKRFADLYHYPMGYFLGEDSPPAADASLVALARAATGLSDADRQEVLRYAEFLRSYGRAERDRKR